MHVADTTVFVNGRIFNGSASVSDFHDCLVVENGKIKHTGHQASSVITSLQNESRVKTIDLKKQYVLPGFIDAHCHFLLLGQSLHKVDLDGSKDLEEIRSRIKTYAKEYPSKERILCRGWMHSMTNGEALASMLDDLDPRPVYIDSKDLHSTWCNTAALTEMNAHTLTSPTGGTIHRSPDGKPSGLLSEACVLLIVWPHLATVATLEEKLEFLRAALAAYHSVGVTGAIDMAMDENAWSALLALRDTYPEKRLPIHIAAHWCILPGSGPEHRLQQVQRAIELNKQYNANSSPDLRMTGIKIICDGVIDACTAALSQPYTNLSEKICDPIWSSDMLDPVVKMACEANLQCALHAIGDLAVSNAVTVLSAHGSPDQRHRIEHLELTHPEDVKRLGELGITASIQPVHADPAILRAWPKLLGPERLKRAFAYKEFVDHGAVLAIGSDAPTAPHPPLKNFYVATTRKSARQPDAGDKPVNEHFRIGVVEALNAATKGAAYSMFAEHSLGSLDVGKEADFVVVDMRFEAEELLNANVRETWVGGKKVFDAGAGA